MDKDEIDRRAAEFAAALVGPLGSKPLERVLRQHVGLFADLRQVGASWRQIAALMMKHGVTRKDGHPVDATQWAAMVSRAARHRTEEPMAVTVTAPAIAASPPATDARVNGDRSQMIRARMRNSAAARSEE